MKKNKSNKVIQLPSTPESYIKARARNLPVGKCYINIDWEKSHFASIVVSRNHINGNFTFGVYLVDLLCLGVKDSFYGSNANTEFTELLDKLKTEQDLEEIDYPLAHNIIYGALEFSESLGFKPHKDFEVSKFVLEEDDDRVELIDIEFGMDGIPAVVFGREKHPANIIATLERTVGKGNFITMDEVDFENEYNDDDEEDFWDEDDDEEFSVEDIGAIIEGTKKASPRKFATMVFAIYDEQCSEQESAEMFEIMNAAEEWNVVEENETDDPFSLSEENAYIYETLFDRIEENAGAAISEIEKQILQVPGECHFYELLTLAYHKNHEPEKENENIIRIYQKFPQSLFAFTNFIIIMVATFNHDELKKLIGSRFDFSHFFPNRKKISYEELVALAASLFTYFSEVTKELHKAVGYAMILAGVVFYGEDKSKANDILMEATDLMFSEIKFEDDLDEKKDENNLRIVD